MHRSTLFIAVFAATLLLSTAAQAQNAAATGQKLYRVVGADGQVFYTDQLPAEDVDKARSEISMSSGVTTDTIGRALTPEERAAAAQQAAATKAAAKQIDDVRQRERVLVTSYPNERDLTRAFEERFTLLDETIKATGIGIDSQRQSLASLLGHAADRELAGQSLNAKSAASLAQMHAQLQQQQAAMQQHETERAALNAEYQDTLALYRRLRTEMDAEAATR